MCNICGIVPGKLMPESKYWEKMCEYATKNKVINIDGCYASGKDDYFVKEAGGNKFFAIVDGVIENKDALRHNLGFRGEIAETESTSELVLLYYILYGKNCFKSFKGAFSVVLWDGEQKELILLSDKVGLKTIFYYYDGFRLVFASEIKNILNFPIVKKDLCGDIYCRLFALSGGSLVGETLFSNIFLVPPGCYVSFKDSKLSVECYYMFSLKDATDSFTETVSGIKYLCQNNFDSNFIQEKSLTGYELKDNVEQFIEKCCLPSPYIDLKTLSNMGSDKNFVDTSGTFNIPDRFRLPSKWCVKQDRDFVNRFLSTIPKFEFHNEKDILRKENVYIRQYMVAPQIVYAKQMACPGTIFPYLREDVVDYTLKNLKYAKKISKHFAHPQQRSNKENYKNLKSLFYEMLSDKNLMSGLIEREELLKFIRLFPRPETMLYLLQVDVWLNMFL